MTLGYHVMLRLEDDRIVLTSRRARRVAARLILRHGERAGLCAFGCADTHLHFVLKCGREQAAIFVRGLTCALHRSLRLGVPFQPARFKRLENQHHFYSAFHYAHRQEQHHDIANDGLHDGCSVPDLLGMRCLSPTLRERVKTFLPRVKSEELLDVLGVGELEAAQLTLDDLADAAAAALGLDELRGRSTPVVLARRAAVEVVRDAWGTAETGRVLGIDARSVRRLRQAPADARLVRAVELQLLLRGALAASLPAEGLSLRTSA